MKTISRIALGQIGFVIGGVIAFNIMDVRLSLIIVNHLILTIGYLCGALAFRK